MKRFLNLLLCACAFTCPADLYALGDIRPIAIRGIPPFKAEVSAETDYSGKANTGFRDSRSDVSQWANQVQALIFPAVRSDLHLRLGGAWQRLSIDTDSPQPLPGKLQAANAILGIDHRVSRDWDIRLEIRPGLYGDFSDIHGGTFNAPFIAGASYFYSPSLLLLGGFMVDARSDVPFFPFVGTRWQFAHNWTLDFVAPKPRIKFQATDTLALFSGFEIRGGSFRVARDFGTRVGDARLNNAILSTQEYRVGGGFEWHATSLFTLEANAGWVLGRRFHYRGPDVNYYSRGAPYAGLSLKLRLPR